MDAFFTSSCEDIRNENFEKFPNGSMGQDGTGSSNDSSGSGAESSEDEYDAENVGDKRETLESSPRERGKKVDVMSAEYLLGSLLNCGSHRLSTMMYKLVRKFLMPKACSVFGASGNGERLPCIASIKSNGKPMLNAWFAKHDVLQLTVDGKRASAKTEVDKFSSDKTAPIVVLKPSE